MNLPRRILALALALASGPAWGAAAALRSVPPGRVPMRVYGPKDGLTSLNPVALAQAPDGQLWVGTQSGLYRFDGVSFRKFGLEDGLPASDIAALLPAADGSLWVGTALRGLARYRQGRFTSFGPDQGLPQTGFKGFAQGADGRIWVATLKGLFVSADAEQFSPAAGWPGGPAVAITAAEGGRRLWVAGPRAIHQVAAGGLLQSFGARQGLTFSEPVALAMDGTGTLWARSSQALLSLPAGAGRFNNHEGLLPPARTPSLHRTPAGAVLVTSNHGIHALRGDGTPTLTTFIKADSPYCSLVDQEGSLWVGTRPLARTLGAGAFEIYTTADGLPSQLMWGIHRAPDGTLWVGTQNGACRATARGWEVLAGTQGKNTRCITSTAGGDLWIGQRNGPPLRYAAASGRLEALGSASGFQARGVYGMLADSRGELWLAQQEGGLARGRRSASGWRFEAVALPGGSNNEDLYGIVQDARGRILVAGTRGLAVLDQGRWRRLTRRDGLLDDVLYQVAALPDGRIAVAYREALGATLLRLEGDRVEIQKHLSKRSGLVGDHVYMLGVDANARLWLGTGTGASVLDGDHLEAFTTEDGLAGDDCDAWSFLADADGSLWLGSNTGLSHYRPPNRAPSLPPLRSLIRALYASGNPLPVDLATQVDIPREQNTLEFQLAALTFLNGAQVEHQVRLNGLENQWQTVLGRSARYPAMAPGHYSFQVRSRRQGGAWGPETALRFRILPAWWERAWVRALAWLTPLGLAVAGVRLRYRILKRRNRELEAKVTEATAEIRSKAEALERVNQRLTRISADKSQMLGIVAHDLRNPLHVIQLHAELLGGETDPGSVDEGSQEIRRISGEMQEMIRRLLDLSHLEAGALDLQMEAVEPRALVAAVVEQHQHRAACKDIVLEVQASETLPPILTDPFYLREVLDNLISNAIKFTPPGPPTRVIRVVLKPGIIEVRDPGPGFTEADLARAFGRFTRLSAQPTAGESSTGLGLSIVKTILEAMQARIDLETTLGAGSTFRIQFAPEP
jgi:signal transduction histidine kinase/ligand-binding sensor domain-containing protein